MQERPLGRTGLRVSEIGFGGWAVGGGWGARDDEAAAAVLDRALALGVTLFDTAFMYGEGHGERLVGAALARYEAGDADRPAATPPRVATKVPPVNRLFPAPAGTPVDDAYPAGQIRAHTERSLADLGRERVDVQQLHVWSPGWLGHGSWEREVAALKDEGLIGAFGVSVNDHDPASVLSLVRSGLVDTVQVIYNVFDQSPEDELLAACAEHGVGVIVRVALDEGGLTGTIGPDTTFAADDWRHRYFRDDRPAQVHAHVAAILDDLGLEPAALPETALRYVLSAPEVSTVVVGTRTVRNLERNVAVADGRGLPADVVTRLHAHRWERNFYRR